MFARCKEASPEPVWLRLRDKMVLRPIIHSVEEVFIPPYPVEIDGDETGLDELEEIVGEPGPVLRS